MNIRFENLQRHIGSAIAALAVSTFFIGAAIGPVNVQPASPAQAEAQRTIA